MAPPCGSWLTGVVEITQTDTSYTGVTYRRVGVVSNGAEAGNFYGGDKTVAYTYDKAGNRTKAWAESFTYDTRNRLATDGTGSYSWNAVGSLGSYAQPGSVTGTYTFDAGGRVTLVTDGTVSSAFGYDGLDRVTARNGTRSPTRVLRPIRWVWGRSRSRGPQAVWSR